jgi:hypothetical protein
MRRRWGRQPRAYKRIDCLSSWEIASVGYVTHLNTRYASQQILVGVVLSSAAALDELTYLASESPAALSGDVLGRYIGTEPSSTSHYKTIAHWLQACAAHPKCNETVSGSAHINSSESPLPTRVVEVVRENGQLQLYLRQTDGLHGAYITLTHRWNDHTGRCITTTANIESRLLGHGFEDLPQLFRDAFAVAEKLNIRYLWIDSICIIQQGDGLRDWRREAPKMAQYYQHSVFTLAGTAEDITGGLLQSYEKDAIPWASKLVRLPYRDKHGFIAGEIYLYKRRIQVVEEYWSEVRESILLRRGWILQEWLLSKRLLWYTPRGLFFECQQEPPRAYDQSQLALSRAEASLQAHLQLKESFHFSNSDILNFWYSMLEVYSGQQLTKPDLDRILAVAGLAQEVGPVLATAERSSNTRDGRQSEVYVAGLWLRNIHHGLLWEEHHSAAPCTGKIEQAPSWSWASLLTQVCWPGRSKGTTCAFDVVGLCFERKGRHTAPDQIVFDGYKIRPRTSATNIATFDPTNLFSCLHIRGRLHVVHVRGYLETEDTLRNAALSTGYSPAPKTCNWRAICSAWRPDIIAGWGSLEQLEARPNVCADYGTAVYALHVSTRYLQPGIWLKRSVPVVDVLFLQETTTGSNAFCRLGVGRISDQDLVAEFYDVEESDFHLV